MTTNPKHLENQTMTSINSLEIPAGIWNADPSHSEISFTVRHAGISKVRGKFTDFTAHAVIGDLPNEISVISEISTASFDSGNEGRDGHVKSADFFDVEEFPKMTFSSTSLTENDGELTLHGDLTVKRVTKSVALAVEFNGVARDPFGLLRAGLEATTTISRKEFGLTWNAALSAGGVLVSDMVTVELDLSFILEEAAE
jgi:polyisoprenoid-binding protein YceI